MNLLLYSNEMLLWCNLRPIHNPLHDWATLIPFVYPCLWIRQNLSTERNFMGIFKQQSHRNDVARLKVYTRKSYTLVNKDTSCMWIYMFWWLAHAILLQKWKFRNLEANTRETPPIITCCACKYKEYQTQKLEIYCYSAAYYDIHISPLSNIYIKIIFGYIKKNNSRPTQKNYCTN